MPQEQPKPPQPRSLLTLQAQVAAGAFAERHLHSVAECDKDMAMLIKMLECTKEAQAALTRNPQRPRAAQMRNLVCVCHSVCPSETEAWVGCFRDVQQQRKKAASESSPPPGSTPRGPTTNCEALKKELELCTQYASTRILHSTVFPKEKHP